MNANKGYCFFHVLYVLNAYVYIRYLFLNNLLYGLFKN